MDIPTGLLPILAPRLGTHRSSERRVTALGGGHGLHGSLQALRRLDAELTAVVTVADDGGSSGRLRREFGVLPPGDLRMALAALCDDTEWGRTWAAVMQHRFETLADSERTLEGQSMGNLLIVALWEMLGDSVEGLTWAGQLLGARGVVLPMSQVPLTIHGTVLSQEPAGGLVSEHIDGQVALAVAAQRGRVSEVALEPADAPACPQAVSAIMESDWNILGPGSWFTSVLPHLLLPGLQRALVESPARTLVTMNLDLQTSETVGMDAAAHLQLLHRYAPGLQIDAVLADQSAVGDTEAFREAAEAIGATVFFDRVARGAGEPVHDPLRLAAAYRDIFDYFQQLDATD